MSIRTNAMRLAVIAAASIGMWISALNVKYRDFAFVVPFITQLGLYLSPVGFSSAVIPARWHLLYSLNPMVGVIEGFRWCVLGKTFSGDWRGLALSTLVVAAIAVTGFNFFRRTERAFADVI